MTLNDLNESLLLEYWVQDVVKSIKKKGTAGAFTQQCKEMGFQKASYECIKHVEKEYEKAKTDFDNGNISKKEYKEWSLKKKRASLAKTFKGISKKKKLKTKEKQK
jgi:hypothetical protein